MENLAEVIKWYVLAGVEDICADETFNALDTPPLPENKVVRKVPVVAAMRPAITDLAQANDSARLNARELCAKANNLSELKKAVESFDGCSLKFSANSTVFGYGNPQAEVMIIGEAPGADEDRIGEPFVGRSGHLLDKMLQAVNLPREDCYITNILPWRPPGNRTPTDGEVAVCLPFLYRQIELIKPKVILLLGASAANAVLDNHDSISQMRGRFMEYTTANGEKIAALATFHPAYLLRSAGQKAKAWNDFLRLQNKLAE